MVSTHCSPLELWAPLDEEELLEELEDELLDDDEELEDELLDDDEELEDELLDDDEELEPQSHSPNTSGSCLRVSFHHEPTAQSPAGMYLSGASRSSQPSSPDSVGGVPSSASALPATTPCESYTMTVLITSLSQIPQPSSRSRTNHADAWPQAYRFSKR
jgi:hypothetical protein